MPSKAEIEAAAKAMAADQKAPGFMALAETALKAAEKVRGERKTVSREWLTGRGGVGPIEEARRKGFNMYEPTGHTPDRGFAGQPYDGGKIARSTGEARTQAPQQRGWADKEETLRRQQEAADRRQPETGQPIPDEAVEAAAKAEWEQFDGDPWESVLPVIKEARENTARNVLTAALPHIEAAIRADERAKVRERIEAERVHGLSPGFQDGIRTALAAIDQEADHAE